MPETIYVGILPWVPLLASPAVSSKIPWACTAGQASSGTPSEICLLSLRDPDV